MTTLHDVAQLANVSDSTASRALRGLDIVRPKTRAKIKSAADSLHFELSRSASALASGRTMRVIMLFGSPLNTWFSAACMQGAYEVLAESGYDIVPVILKDATNANEFFNTLLKNEHNIDGIILPSIRLDSHSSEDLSSLKIPTVGLDASFSPVLNASVALDNKSAMRSAVYYLQELGHERIGYVQYPNRNIFFSSAEERGTFFLQAAKEYDFSQASVHVYPAKDYEVNSSLEEPLSQLARRIASSDAAPTALCVENDEAAIILMRQLRLLGVKIPEDISIIGFDDNDNAELMGLTTLKQDPVHMAKIAAQLLKDLMAGNPIERKQTWIQTSLVKRESTSSPRSERTASA